MPQRDPREFEATNQEPRDAAAIDGVLARLNDARMSRARRGWLRLKVVEGVRDGHGFDFLVLCD